MKLQILKENSKGPNINFCVYCDNCEYFESKFTEDEEGYDNFHTEVTCLKLDKLMYHPYMNCEEFSDFDDSDKFITPKYCPLLNKNKVENIINLIQNEEN